MLRKRTEQELRLVKVAPDKRDLKYGQGCERAANSLVEEKCKVARKLQIR
jgi:hypothetical protein